MTERKVGIRFEATGGAQVEGEARQVGDAERHLQRLKRGVEPASGALRALDAAAREARTEIDDMSASVLSSVGPFGRVAAALGPVGLAVAAAAAVYGGLGAAGAAAARDIAAVGDAADRLQIDPAVFERLSASLTLQGQSDQGLEAAIRTLQQRLGEAQEGSEAARAEFEALGVSVGGPLEQALRQLADGLAGVEDPAQRVAIANRLLGESGGALLTVLGDGADGFDALAAKAEELGLVYGGELIRASQSVTAELETQSRIVETQMNAALAPFARLLLDVKGAFVELLGPLGRAVTEFRAFFGLLSDGEQRSRLAGQVRDTIAALEERVAEQQALLAAPNTIRGERGERAREAGERVLSDLRRQLADARAEMMMLTDPPSGAEGGGDGGSGGGGGGGGGGASAPAAAPVDEWQRGIEAAERRIRAIEDEAAVFGLSRAATEAYRIEQDLLTAAMEEYGQITEATREIIAVYAEDVRAATAEIEAMEARQREAQRAADETRRAFEGAAQGVGALAQAAIDAERPLQSLLAAAARFSIEALAGQGPFGGLFNQVLGVASGGLGGLLPGAAAAVAPGAAFGADFIVPGYGGHDRRLMSMPVTPGERVRVTRPGERTGAAPAPSVTINAVTHVTVQAGAGGEDAAAQGRAIAEAVETQTLRVLQRELRHGGLLRPARGV